MTTYTITKNNLEGYGIGHVEIKNDINLEIRLKNITPNILRYKGIITNNKAQFENEIKSIFKEVDFKDIIISDDNNKLTIKSYNFSEKEEL
ncbi:hypothetical protein R4J17_06390 [Brachyspira intermedia]|uniref:hypothetical protein n=1 Tax=Brachyspira intermedia TaxID=84377 RepID=UPI0030061E26